MAHSLTTIVLYVPEHFDIPPVVRDWVNKGLGMSTCVCVTGHMKDPVLRIEKSRGLPPGGRFPLSFIQVIIITGLLVTPEVIRLYVLALKMASDADWA